jgi:diguanylate cyclase (GGDEF)-like protein/PAS domain S-box-containing protein
MFTGNNQQSHDVVGGVHNRLRLHVPWLILSFGIVLSIVAYFLVRNWEEAMISADFNMFAATHAAAIHREAIRHFDASTSIVGLYDASKEVDRREFRQFSKEILTHHADVQAVMWVPRVSKANSDKLRKEAVQDGLTNFHIHEPNEIESANPNAGMSDYFPVYYVQPEDYNADLLGADLMADSVYRGVLEAARDTGEVTASAPVRLRSNQGSLYGLLLTQAVYHRGMALRSLSDRRAALKGFVLQLFRVPDFVEESLLDSGVLGVDLSVYYEMQSGTRQLIYHRPSLSREDGEDVASTLRNFTGYATALKWETSLDLLGKSWQLVFTPAPKFWSTHPIWRSWVVLGAGLLMSIVLGTYSFRLSRQSIRAESLARNLSSTNNNLEKEIEERARIEAQAVKLSYAIEQSADAVMITDSNGIIEYVNSAFETMTGYSLAETIGMKAGLVKSGQHDSKFYSQLWGAITRGEVFQDVMINRRKDGGIYYEEKTITPLKDRAENITHYIATGKDITERMQTQERLHYLAYYDLLTELPNRLLFLERITHALKSRIGPEHQLAIMCLDIDRFKMINDTLGHGVGDALLRKISTLLQALVGEGDTVARLGGDGFGILFEDMTSPDGLAAQGRRILQAFSQPIHVEGHELYIAASIGIGVYPEDGKDANTLLKNVDAALHRSKDQGGNNIQYYSSEMSSKAFERLSLETSLRRAVEHEEFRVFYQPQVDLVSGKVMGAEALIRWEHPDLGLVSPLEFIPLLEETGLIVPVGEWVLRRACEWAVSQQKHGEMRVSVNLSGRQFRVSDLSDQVTRALTASRLNPELLELEITESVLMQSDKISTANLMALDKLGVRFAIDDFGTGYSSLGYLKRFPIKTLKIDRTFIRDITDDQDDTAIVTAIIAMAHSLKMEVVAEGVETKQQLDYLRRLDCDVIQGYLISRPLPVAEINRFMLRGRQVLDVAHINFR